MTYLKKELPHLNFISLSNNKLNHVDGHMFKDLKELLFLNFNSNNLTNIPVLKSETLEFFSLNDKSDYIYTKQFF